MAYSKYYKEEKWDHIQMQTDEWEFVILKELKGAYHVPRISQEGMNLLKGYINFYLEEFDT